MEQQTNGGAWWRWIDKVAPARFGGRLGLGVVALGLIVIGIGWNGASGSGGEVNGVPVVQAQLPWLLSGGFLGLGIVVLGAAFMIASAFRESNASLRPVLEALMEAMSKTTSSPSAPSNLQGLVLAGTASYHLSDCRVAQGRQDGELLTLEEATERGLSACRVCHPPVLQSPMLDPYGH